MLPTEHPLNSRSLVQRPANSGPRAKCGPLPVFVNKTLLERSLAHSFTHGQWLLSRYNAELNSHDGDYSPRSWKHLPSGPLEKRLIDSVTWSIIKNKKRSNVESQQKQRNKRWIVLWSQLVARWPKRGSEEKKYIMSLFKISQAYYFKWTIGNKKKMDSISKNWIAWWSSSTNYHLFTFQSLLQEGQRAQYGIKMQFLSLWPVGLVLLLM